MSVPSYIFTDHSSSYLTILLYDGYIFPTVYCIPVFNKRFNACPGIGKELMYPFRVKCATAGIKERPHTVWNWSDIQQEPSCMSRNSFWYWIINRKSRLRLKNETQSQQMFERTPQLISRKFNTVTPACISAAIISLVISVFLEKNMIHHRHKTYYCYLHYIL